METSLKLELARLSLRFIAPELKLCIGIIILLIVGLVAKKRFNELRQFRAPKGIAIKIMVLDIIVLLLMWPTTEAVNLFNGMLTHNTFNSLLRLVIAVTGLFVVMTSPAPTTKRYSSEYFTLILTIILGGQLLVMSNHMVMVIISLELMSIPAYILAGFAFTKESAEASMKYFIYGSVATAFMIFGMSWLYGLGKGLELGSPVFIDQLGYNNHSVMFAACLFVVAGLLFKMAAAPFHLWAPDVYQATPYPVLMLFSTVPKIAAGAVLFKAIGWFDLNGQSRYDWQTVASALAILTLAVGNFSALWQKNVKRLMAYSSIGQAGFLLSAAVIQTQTGSSYFYFYAAVLAIGTVLVFLMLGYFERHQNASSVQEFAGLGRKNALSGVLLTIGLLSLTGLPITAGFTAKLFVFSGILEVWQTSGKPILMALFAFGLINTVVALYYYLQVPYQMFLKEANGSESKALSKVEIGVGLLLAIALVILFLWPSLIIVR
jgi:NADH-quinone oxidoreductase subunit N